jgi:hypothetical protein
LRWRAGAQWEAFVGKTVPMRTVIRIEGSSLHATTEHLRVQY